MNSIQSYMQWIFSLLYLTCIGGYGCMMFMNCPIEDFGTR